MDFTKKIDEEIKKAMKAKNSERLRALRAIKSQLLLAKTSGKGKDEISEEEAIKIMQKMVKQRKDSAEIYKQKGRDDLYNKEMAEIQVISEFLPQPLSEEELEKKIKEIITELNASGMQDMRKVMPVAQKRLGSRADGKKIADIVKKLLSQG